MSLLDSSCHLEPGFRFHFTCYVTLELFDSSVPQFPHLYNRGNNHTNLIILLARSNTHKMVLLSVGDFPLEKRTVCRGSGRDCASQYGPHRGSLGPRSQHIRS